MGKFLREIFYLILQGGDLALKFVQQLVACSQNQRPMNYHSFNEIYEGKNLAKSINEIMVHISSQNLNVGDLVGILLECEKEKTGVGRDDFENIQINVFNKILQKKKQ